MLAHAPADHWNSSTVVMNALVLFGTFTHPVFVTLPISPEEKKEKELYKGLIMDMKTKTLSKQEREF